jgi:hypothetical protein
MPKQGEPLAEPVAGTHPPMKTVPGRASLLSARRHEPGKPRSQQAQQCRPGRS